ncbi:MAG: twin-arginine translocase subunit TatC, partial [Thermoguttaceae bacterium]|nr:twin-arginine translocase subunit TatC [Thermoguttaceae bacterium]
MKPQEDNLFKESSMSFGDHLEELRGCVLRCILGIVVCFIIGLFFGSSVMNIIQQPLTRSLVRYLDKQNQTKVEKMIEQGYPKEIAQKAFDSGLLVETVYIHKDELKKISVDELGMVEPETPSPAADEEKSNALGESQTKEGQTESATQPGESAADSIDVEPVKSSWEYIVDFWDYMNGNLPKIQSQKDVSQYEKNRSENFVKVYVWKPKNDSDRAKTRAMSAQEPFMIYIQASLLLGVVLACPWVLYQLWMFIASGLYPHERKYVYIYFPMSLALFIAGVLLAFFWVFDPVLGFLMLFNEWMNIEPDLRINEWLGFFLMLPIGFGLSFQLPLIMLFWERIGITSIDWYKRNWRMAVLLIAGLSVILTPADPTSMMLMFIPLTFLFVLGIWLCQFMPRPKSPYDEDDDDDDEEDEDDEEEDEDEEEEDEDEEEEDEDEDDE